MRSRASPAFKSQYLSGRRLFSTITEKNMIGETDDIVHLLFIARDV